MPNQKIRLKPIFSFTPSERTPRSIVAGETISELSKSRLLIANF
jgi:hypothetical protein